jgi:hypothetical protein
MATRKSCRDRQNRKDRAIQVTAHQLAKAEGLALRQVTITNKDIQATSKYGHTPQEKPAHAIQIALENYNSICVTSGNA